LQVCYGGGRSRNHPEKFFFCPAFSLVRRSKRLTTGFLAQTAGISAAGRHSKRFWASRQAFDLGGCLANWPGKPVPRLQAGALRAGQAMFAWRFW
jgi:hypothetical protein